MGARAAFFALLVAGCGSANDDAGADLRAPMPDDLAVAAVDLGNLSDLGPFDLWAPPVDLQGWCVGTTLAGVDADGGATGTGECARKYFEQLAVCFRPAGRCNAWVQNSFKGSCWEDGAYTHLASTGTSSLSRYVMQGRACMTSTSPDVIPPFVDLDFCMSTQSYECGQPSNRGQRASYIGGVFTCPDGTQVTIDLHGCPALDVLLGVDPIGCNSKPLACPQSEP